MYVSVFVWQIFPVLIGDFDEATQTYGNFFEAGCKPTCPEVAVASVRLALRQHLDSQGLGAPIQADATVASVLAQVLECQGTKIEGPSKQAIADAVSKVLKMAAAAAAAAYAAADAHIYSKLTK